MGKTGKWIRSFLTGKKDKDKKIITTNESAEVINGHHSPTTPLTVPASSSSSSSTTTTTTTTPKEKKRWSFRRSSTSSEPTGTNHYPTLDSDEKKHAQAVAAVTSAAIAAAKAAATVIQLAGGSAVDSITATTTAAAVKIQSYYRGYLARKALNALRGLVKLQALVRGHLIRKQAATTLRCMQALVTAQERARAQRLWMVEESKNTHQFSYRKSTHEGISRRRLGQDYEVEEDVKTVEMDTGEWKGKGRTEHHRVSTHRAWSKQQQHDNASPAPSGITDQSPRAYSGHFEEYISDTAQCSPPYSSGMSKPDPFGYARSDFAAESPYNEYPFYPSYMANTESSRAKVRSHSAPKQRPESFERQASRRRPSIEGRNVPRSVKMQRSSSHVGTTQGHQYQYPWSLKLDRSSVSLKGSECGSTSTVLANTNYCRSLVGFEVQGNRY